MEVRVQYVDENPDIGLRSHNWQRSMVVEKDISLGTDEVTFGGVTFGDDQCTGASISSHKGVKMRTALAV
ncbi:hypothetical protein VP1G_11064 [Cytospora mali]|uniref:Uncharacterized protein n=1 Tax=Cytospora mali TaxID=578113 RepID=A0A194V3P2_CYTMA|nr:hypothetical protein VP1G_11064 [Valsa mali var. pyri (nom. inval.)]